MKRETRGPEREKWSWKLVFEDVNGTCKSTQRGRQFRGDALDQLEETRAHKEYIADTQVTVVSNLIAD